MPPRPPKRCYEVSIKIGADSAKEVIVALEQITLEFETRGPRQITSGAPSAGWITEVEVDPNQTPENYHRQLDAYLEEIRK